MNRVSVVSGATAAGLLQCSVGCIPKPCTALAIGDERGRAARLRVIKVGLQSDYKLAVLV